MLTSIFWMKKYGHATLKRTYVMSNSLLVASLDMSKLAVSQKACDHKTYKTYYDKNGKNAMWGAIH